MEEEHEPELRPGKVDEDAAGVERFLENRTLHKAVIRVAGWSLTVLRLSLLPTMISLFILNYYINSNPDARSKNNTSSPPTTSTATSVAAIAFWSFLYLSFLGRWTYDLAVTQLTLMLVPSTHRSTFSGTEQAIVSTISLLHWVAAAIWHRQSDFIWLALVGALAVAGAIIAFMWWCKVSQ